MVKIIPSKEFERGIKNLDKLQSERLGRQIRKIIANPQVGKPLKYKRGERSLYIKPFRLIYALRGDDIILLKFEHRKSIYE